MTTASTTQKYREFFKAHPTIDSQLPIGFADKDLEWSSLVCSCGKCGQEIPGELVRGTVTSLIPSVITINAIGCCTRCLLLIPFDYRFRNDGSMEWQHEGRWVRTYGQRIPWWTRLIERLKLLKPLWQNLL